MNEQTPPPPIPPDDDPNSRTQPGKRLRRLLAGSEENDATMASRVGLTGPKSQEPGASQDQSAPGAPPPAPAAAQPAAPAQPEAVSPAGPSAITNSPAPTDVPGATDSPPLTNAPASTDAPGQPRISDTQRHPTGTPDSTGGWYGPGQTGPVSPDAAQTRAIPPVNQTRANRGPARRNEPGGPPPSYTPPPPAVGNSGQLPRRVEEVDPNATQVTPAAYQSRRPIQAPPGQRQGGYPSQPPAYTPPRQSPYNPPPPAYTRSVGTRGIPAAYPAPRPRASGWKRGLGCALRLAIALLFLVVFVVVAAGSWLVFQYYAIARDLPPVAELRNRASQFETTHILDRNGTTLYEILDPSAGRRTYVPLTKISPNVIAATLATEDREFYNHPGFDPIAIARAFYYNYTTGEVVSGASTITQQLARTLLLPGEINQRTYERKAREIVLAAEITRRYSKDEILELYLNEINYGNLAYGIQAAAETYFGTSADQLTLAQAAFLAGLPQSPGVYDIHTNRAETINRFKQVILLMMEDSSLKNCIPVKGSEKPVCVDEAAAIQMVTEIESYDFKTPQNNMRYPHWVTYIRSLLEAQFEPQTIYRSGFTVYTTLDPAIQDKAQEIITQQVESLADRNAHNGALVAIRPMTGEILAMVGSPDFNDQDHAGQINMAVSPRQPGSSIKPLTYVAAFEKGWTPATLIWDVPTDFPPSGDPNDTRPPYQPVNYDERFHGPVTVRSALANSYNIPAVKTLNFVGVYGNGGLIALAQRLGINSLTRNDYGLALTLGGGEVRLLDMVSAFGTFGNLGKRMPPIAITKIVDFKGNVVYEYKPPAAQQVIRPEHAFLITSILSDNEARTPMFGPDSVLNLPFPAAAKTGTTNDFRDNWTIGYTPDLVTGVWIGNADYTPMENVTGLTGAAPAWSAFMQYAVPLVTNNNPTLFQRPANIIEKVICTISGTEPSEYCPQQRSEFFAANQPPQPKEDDLWKKVRIDTWTGLRASPECSDFTSDKFTLNVDDPWAVSWIKDSQPGRAWAESVGFSEPIEFVPKRECKISDPRPTIIFSSPNDGQTITNSPLDIYAVVKATDQFKQFRLEWSQGDDPVEWKPLVENITNQSDKPERIHTWELGEVPSGKITLRIYLESTDNDRYAERRLHLTLKVPTPTPTATPTTTPTPIPTRTPTPTSIPTLPPAPTETIPSMPTVIFQPTVILTPGQPVNPTPVP